MKVRTLKFLVLCIFFNSIFVLNPLEAQLNTIFENAFNQFLILETEGPGEHGTHFEDAAKIASKELAPALNNLIAGNISSFPLSSTTAGISFDFSSGQPVSISESLGPIFAETAKTVGKRKMNFGFNYTFLNFSKLRGLDTKEIKINFFHQDVNAPGLGDSGNESDVMTVDLDLNIDASIYAFYITAGITNNLDISVALPLISLNLSGNPTAIFDSFTLISTDTANHHFGGDFLNPKLDNEIEYENGSVTGIGDIAVRLKYNLLQGEGIHLAAMLDTRIPTGDEKNFLGTGKTNARLLVLLSKKIGDFTPHANIGYDSRGATDDSDEFEFAIGFDHKVISGLTFAFDVLGEIDLENLEKYIPFF